MALRKNGTFSANGHRCGFWSTILNRDGDIKIEDFRLVVRRGWSFYKDVFPLELINPKTNAYCIAQVVNEEGCYNALVATNGNIFFVVGTSSGHYNIVEQVRLKQTIQDEIMKGIGDWMNAQ